MATPLWDALSVEHSRNIGDPVAAAATNGNRISSAQRDTHLNKAVSRWLEKMVQAATRTENAGGNAAQYWDALQGYTYTEAQSLVANAKSLSSWNGGNGIVKILSVYDTTLTKPCRYVPQSRYDFANTGGNTLLTGSGTNLLWSEINGTLYVLGAGATDSITLRYVKRHVPITSNQASTAVVYDAAWSATSTAVTGFTGVVSTHVGGTFIGTDNGGNLFSRVIVAYVSSTAFTIATALTADGAGTLGYIVPPNGSDIAVTSPYWPQILDLAFAVAKFEEGEPDTIALAVAKEAAVDKEIFGA